MFKIEAEFYKHVDLEAATRKLSIESDVVDFVYRFWLLKRKANGNKPLLAARSEGKELLSNNQETEREKMKKFVALRQDLERVRNLCYMVSRREKLQPACKRVRTKRSKLRWSMSRRYARIRKPTCFFPPRRNRT